MNIDAALVVLSFVSFLALLVTWIAAPLRAAAPVTPMLEAAPPAAVAA